jgi:hypothetical protein
MDLQPVKQVVDYYARSYAAKLYDMIMATIDVEQIKRIVASLGLEIKENEFDEFIGQVLQSDHVENPARRQLAEQILEIYDSDSVARASKISQEYQLVLQNSPSFYKLVADGMRELELADFEAVLDNADPLDDYLQESSFDILIAEELGKKGNYRHLVLAMGSVNSVDYSKVLLDMYDKASRKSSGKVLSIKLKR